MAACASPGCRFKPHSSGQFQNFCCIACAESRGGEHGPRCQRVAAPAAPRSAPKAPAPKAPPQAQRASSSSRRGSAGAPAPQPPAVGDAASSDWAAQIQQASQRNAAAERARAEQRQAEGGAPEMGGPPEKTPAGGWQERKGYRMRAANDRAMEETRRIHEADEQVLSSLQAQKRAEAREIIRESRGGTLGSAEHKDMQSARLALVEKLERESDPKFRRMQRKEEEKRQREEAQQEKDLEEQKRQEEWKQRQKRQAERDRELNEQKRNHWQAQDGSSPAAASSQQTPTSCIDVDDEECPAPDTSLMIGRWLYGSKPNEYRIQLGPDGRLHFDDGGRFTGVLEAQPSGHYQAALVAEDGSVFGAMRFMLRGEGAEASLVSNFRKEGKPDWGKDSVARRAGESEPSGSEGSQRQRPPAPSAGSGTSEGEDGVRAPMRTGYEDRLIDPDVWQCMACTLINDPRASCCSACGNARPRRPAPAPVLSINPQPAASASPPAAAPEPAPAPAEEPAEAEAEAQEPADLLAWLQSHRLEEYHEALLEQGFEELGDLRAAEQSEMDALFDLVGVKPGHMLRFRRALRGGGAQGGPRECPVCLAGPQEGVNVALTPCGHVFCGEHARQAFAKGDCPVCRGRPGGTQRIFA